VDKKADIKYMINEDPGMIEEYGREIIELREIVTTNRDMAELSDEALRALDQWNNPQHIFVRAGGLVRIDRSKDKDEKTRPVIRVMTDAALRGRMARTARYVRVVSTKKGGVEHLAGAPPIEIVKDIMALPEQEWPFPYLTGLSQIPVLRKDGSLFLEPGYDLRSCLYYLPEEEICIDAGMQPGEAVELLKEIFCDFPFDNDASWANCLGLLFTLVLRELIDGPVPLVIIDKPQQGTGASLLANACSIIATGEHAFVEAFPTGRDKENELRKRITSILVEGRSHIVLDNIENTFQSAVLGALLTCTTWQDRALGENRLIALPHRCVWMATGNNVTPVGDMPRRCYNIKLDAKQARPWQRTGFKHPELLKWVRENRGRVLSAIFKLAQDWIFAARPVPDNLPVLGNFDEWAHVIGGILHHAGITGFLGNLEEMYEKAEEDEGWEDFLAAWYELFGEEQHTVKEIAYALTDNEKFQAALPENLDAANKNFTRLLGHAIKRKEGMRYPNNLFVKRVGVSHHAIKWQIKKGELGDSGESVAGGSREKKKNIFPYVGTPAQHSPNSSNSPDEVYPWEVIAQKLTPNK
jgi:hypothetical protein